jgi:hypothetical protein
VGGREREKKKTLFYERSCLKKTSQSLDMVVYGCNPRSEEAKASLGYIMRSCLKKPSNQSMK